MFRLLWSFLKEGLRGEAFHHMLQWLLAGKWPVMWSVVMGAVAWVEHFPWTIIGLVFVFTFGGISWGLFNFHQFITQRSIAHKLQYQRMLVAKHQINGANGPALDWIKMGIELKNTSIFPLEFHVENLTSIVGNRINSNKEWIGSKTITVPPNSGAFYYDAKVVLAGVEPNSVQQGRFEYVLKYGKPGHLKYFLKGAKVITLALDDKAADLAAFETIDVTDGGAQA